MTDERRARAVYVQTNEGDGNRLLAFPRGVDGTLARPAAVDTGGTGDGTAHLPSQGSVSLTDDGRYVLVVNAGGGELSVLTADERPQLVHVARAASRPRSVAERNGLVYVLDTDPAALLGFRLHDGRVEPLEGSRRGLPDGADPAQVGFTPDGSRLVVSDRGNDTLLVYPVAGDGRLGGPATTPSPGPTPYGFAFTHAGTLVVTEAFGAERGKAAASSYRLVDGRAEAVSRSVPNGRSEICWAVVTADGRYAFTTNFADGAISRYAIGEDGAIALETAVAAAAVEGETGLRDAGLTPDDRFLYAIDADSGRVFGWALDGDALRPVGSWNGLPATVAGLAAN